VPSTIEGEIVSWADRIAYCAHDFEDAVHAGIVSASDLPDQVTGVVGNQRRDQLRTFIEAIVKTICETGHVGAPTEIAQALAGLRRFNYERIYTRPESMAQSHTVIGVLQHLVAWYLEHPDSLPPDYRDDPDHVHGAVSYVAGMTDRFAFDQAVALLGWNPDRLPRGIGHGA
jgi:dGTPase